MEVLTVGLSKHDWSLHRKAPIDQARHNEKVKEAIRGNIADIIADESIITSDGQKIVKVPVRSLALPRFRYNTGEAGIGQGTGKSKIGDIVGQVPDRTGSGRGAGNEPGTDYYDAEITIDELAEIVFADLGLPNLEQKQIQQIEHPSVRFNDIRKSGPMAMLNKKRTVLENIRRNAKAGNPHFGQLQNRDLRFTAYTEEIQPDTNAVVIAMRDASGSMGEFEKYITRSCYFWMTKFLRQKYPNVEIAFLTHDVTAKEVDEKAFFSLGEGGGTKVSSVYQLALDIIGKRYDPNHWNIYPFHFSDGDNSENDNKFSAQLAKELVEKCNFFGYGEIRQYGYGASSTLMEALIRGVHDPRLIPVTIASKEDVSPALKKFFTPVKSLAA